MCCGEVVGVLGFEPRQTESESVVLPLHYTPVKKLSSLNKWKVFSWVTRIRT